MGSSPSTSKNNQKKTEESPIPSTINHHSDNTSLVPNPQVEDTTIIMDRTQSPDEESGDELSDLDELNDHELVQKGRFCMDKIKSVHNQRTPEGLVSSEFRKSTLLLISILSMVIDNDNKEKKEMLQSLTKYGIEYETIVIYCKICAEILETGNNADNSGIVDEQSESLYHMLSYLVNSSDDNPKFCGVVSEQTQFLQSITKKLKDWSGPHLNITLQKSADDTLDLMITVLHNVAMFEDNVYKVRSAGCIEALKPYLDSKDKTIRLLTLATLADIVNESESEILKSKGDVIKFLMWTISMAMEKSDRTWDGWSLKELARIVRQVARNDNNKRTVVKHGAVPLLIKLTGSDVIEEQIEAVAAIWTLSFDKQNREEMLNKTEWEVTETLERMSQSQYDDLRKISKKALWTIKDQATVTNGRSEQQTTVDDGDSHIMISYNWGHQPMVKQIRDNLRNCGIKVWMDVDDMQGSTLQAMARAVEKADIVLVCYSFKYKNSDNCRAEAEYAFQLKKKIIPVKMEQNYKADGWLGFIIGAKLFYDFSGKYPFENKAKELTREIHETLKKTKGIVAPVPEQPIMKQIEPMVQTSIPVMSSMKQEPHDTNTISVVRKWKPAQVEKWLDNNNLPKKLLGRLRGKDVAFLRLLIHESPNTFYQTIKEQLGIKDLQTMTDLRFALDDIDTDVQTSSSL